MILLGDGDLLECTWPQRYTSIPGPHSTWLGLNERGDIVLHDGPNAAAMLRGTWKIIKRKKLLTVESIMEQLSSGAFNKQQLGEIYRLLYAMGCRINSDSARSCCQ
jgi:hypothetical protein